MEVEVLPSGKGKGKEKGKGNIAFWSDHGKAFVVTCSGDREKRIQFYFQEAQHKTLM
jgi:hypothetical protein